LSSFWSISAFWGLAVLFVAVALAFVLPPLLRKRATGNAAGRRSINIAVYRDQLKEMEADHHNGLLTDEQFNTAKIELEARLAQDALESQETAAPVRKGGRWLGFTLGGSIPVLAFVLYFLLGTPQAIMGVTAGSQGADNMADNQQIQTMVKSLEDKLKQDPNNGRGWALLARSYVVMDRWQDAEKAYATAAKLLPKESSVLSGYAEVLAVEAGRNLNGKPMDMVRKALALNPNDEKGLELAGVYAFQNKDYAKAIKYWKHLLGSLPPNASYAQDIQSALERAERLAGGVNSSGQPLDNLSEMDQKPVSGASISGMLELAAGLKDKVSPNDTVFLYASAEDGGGPPLAALRTTVGQLPMSFQLDDSQAMMPNNKLSGHRSVILVARVSKSGAPEGRSGDLEGKLSSVKVGSKGVKLVINTVTQ
jgi:cytochrome c-type biogenesis protein CcmH